MRDKLSLNIIESKNIYIAAFTIGCLFIIAAFSYQTYNVYTQAKIIETSRKSQNALQTQGVFLSEKLTSVSARLRALEETDERLRNNRLEEELKFVKDNYSKSVIVYEEILKLRDSKINVTDLEKNFADVLTFLSEVNYASAAAELAALDSQITKIKAPPVDSSLIQIAANLKVDNTPPGSGYKQTLVDVNGSKFVVDLIGADLGSTKVVIETASEGDCIDDCPVGSLASFVAKAGGYAGINGPYFCPESYPSCAGKKNSFDTLLMNRNKTYFNSANNIYSVVPAAIFGPGSVRFVGASSEWGRDTSVDSVIASQPLLLQNGEVKFGGDDEVKRATRGYRSFIASKGNTAYIGVVRGANVAEVALVLKAMGMDHALNLDSGGSTALYANGRYIAGPGRNTPFGIVFVSR